MLLANLPEEWDAFLSEKRSKVQRMMEEFEERKVGGPARICRGWHPSPFIPPVGNTLPQVQCHPPPFPQGAGLLLD